MSIATLAPGGVPPDPAPSLARSRVSETALAELLIGLARAPEVWSAFIPSLQAERSSVHLLETEAFDVWLLAWPPTSRVDPHDHGDSAGAFTVVRGTLTEVRWTTGQRVREVGVGEVITVAQGVVHDVVAGADGPVPALSLHAYAPPLRSMGFYGDDGSRLIAQVAVDPEPAVLR